MDKNMPSPPPKKALSLKDQERCSLVRKKTSRQWLLYSRQTPTKKQKTNNKKKLWLCSHPHQQRPSRKPRFPPSAGCNKVPLPLHNNVVRTGLMESQDFNHHPTVMRPLPPLCKYRPSVETELPFLSRSNKKTTTLWVTTEIKWRLQIPTSTWQ